jgi:hypothetical protein
MPLGSAARVAGPSALAVGKRTCQGCLEPSTGAPERFGSKRSGGEWGAPDAPQARATRLHSTLRTSIQLRKATRPQSASSRYQLRGDDRRPSMASIPSIARRRASFCLTSSKIFVNRSTSSYSVHRRRSIDCTGWFARPDIPSYSATPPVSQSSTAATVPMRADLDIGGLGSAACGPRRSRVPMALAPASPRNGLLRSTEASIFDRGTST